MSATLLDRIDEIICEVATARFGAVAARDAALFAPIAAVSTRYNALTFASSRAWSDEELLARLRFFTLADLPKTAYPLAELQSRGCVSEGPLRVLDVGAGCGAQTLGLVTQLGDPQRPRQITLDAVDADPRCLELMQEILTRCVPESVWGVSLHLCCRRANVNTSAGVLARTLAEHGERPYDLILLGTLLAELPEERHLPLVAELLGLLRAEGALLLIEPALRAQSRGLHRLRERLLAEQFAEVFAPCARQGPCPALTLPKDWCHELRTWQPPPRLRRLATATGLRRRDLKWSYLTLRQSGPRLASADQRRVVSALLRSKGKSEVFLCGQAGRHRAVLLNRHLSAANVPFTELARGQLVRIEGAVARGDQIRILPETIVTREDPAQAART